MCKVRGDDRCRYGSGLLLWPNNGEGSGRARLLWRGWVQGANWSVLQNTKKLLKYCNTTKSSCKNLKANFKFCINYKNTRSILVQKYVFWNTFTSDTPLHWVKYFHRIIIHLYIAVGICDRSQQLTSLKCSPWQCFSVKTTFDHYDHW